MDLISIVDLYLLEGYMAQCDWTSIRLMNLDESWSFITRVITVKIKNNRWTPLDV